LANISNHKAKVHSFIGSHYVAQAGLEIMTFLLQPPEGWGCRPMLPCLLSFFLFMRTGSYGLGGWRHMHHANSAKKIKPPSSRCMLPSELNAMFVPPVFHGHLSGPWCPGAHISGHHKWKQGHIQFFSPPEHRALRRVYGSPYKHLPSHTASAPC
jgi:hypothetical protein